MSAPSTRVPSREAPSEVELTGPGMRVRHTPLYLDACRVTDLCFLSHAHSDHIARHRQAIGTAATLALAQMRVGELRSVLPAPYRQPFRVGALELELLPAGHVLGSAQIRVTRNGRRIVYTGDLNPVPGLTAEPAEVARCEVLVIESTFGHPRYAFPPREETYEAIRAFARRTLEQGATPVFFAYTLGKAQEAIKLLENGGFRVVVHPEIAEVCEVYARFGCPLAYRRWDGRVEPGEVVVLPPQHAGARDLAKLGPVRTAVLTGWAVERGARYQNGTDEAFPLSDHGDFEALVSYAQATGAERVFTVHGFAKELAACLRDRGMWARPLDAPRQLELL